MKKISGYLFSVLLSTVLFAQEPIDVNAYAHKLYGLTTQAYETENWTRLRHFSDKLYHEFTHSPFANDALYYLAVSRYHTKDYVKANQLFTDYLKEKGNPKFYIEALNYKYKVAEALRNGAKVHMFGNKGPKILSGKEYALEIYNELINSLPNEEIAAKAMFAKGQLLAEFNDYNEAVDTFEQLIRTFEKQQLAIESYIEIQKVYLAQVSPKTQDSDLLDLARLNIKKFSEAFPSEERIQQTVEIYNQMLEVYAEGLYDIGRFFERTKKTEAAKIYYGRILHSFGSTKYAKLSKQRLVLLTQK